MRYRHDTIKRLLLPVAGGALLAAAFALVARRSRPHSGLKYDARYKELVRLKNGERVLLRLLHPQDRFRIVKEMRRASDESRYLRFHRAKSELSQDELRYLTEIDGTDHFAMVAVDARGNGLGVARFIRFPSSPEIADLGIGVTDRMQGQGLGRLFLHRLREAAAERGITTLRAEVLPQNSAAMHLLKNSAPTARQSWEDGCAIFDLPTLPSSSVTKFS